MESKISEKMMREVYFKAFGKEYDSLDRKQTPLPLEIAYKVALNKLKRDKKYEFGGEITEDIYYKSVNDFVFFCLNYPSNFFNIFGGFEKDFANKFKAYYNGYGSYGAMIKLYIELDSNNRRLLTDFAYKNYNISFSKSNISEVEYYNSVNHFVFFCFNFPNNFMEAFPINLRVNLSEKWSDAYRKKGSIGAMIYFWSLLSDNNRKKLADWVRVNYTGTRLYELGGALGDVAGMLPSPLPMSTIQPMAKGGQIELFADGGGIKVGDVVEVKEPNYGRDRDYYVVADNVGYDRNDFLISDVNKREQGVFEEEQLKKLYADGGKLNEEKYDYEDIGQFSIPDSEWKNYSDEEFYKIGKKIVNEQFDGNVGVAYDTIVYKKMANGGGVGKKSDRNETQENNFGISYKLGDKFILGKNFGNNKDVEVYITEIMPSGLFFKVDKSDKIFSIKTLHSKGSTYTSGEYLIPIKKEYADGGNVLEPYIYYFNDGENDITFTNFEEAYNEAEKLGYNKFRDNLGGEYFVNKDLTKKTIYQHKSNPYITLEFLEYTNKGVKGLQKNPKSLSKKERKDGIIVYYSDSEMKELFDKKYADGGGVDDFKMSYDEMTTYEKSNHIHYNPINSRWEVTKNGENKEFWNQEQAEKFAGFEFENEKDARYSRKKYEALFGYADGGGVKSDYYIFEGVDNLNGNPLYRVESTSESDIEYVGEWHTNRNDAQNELDELLNKSKKTLGVVKVIFENPAYNYSTNVGVDVTEEEARNYFVGKMFDVGAFPKENMQKVIDIEFSKSKDNYADGGEIVDLFEDYENIPANVQEVLDRYSEKYGEDFGEMNYNDMAEMHKEIEKLGYTFDSGLDNMPYGLRPIGVELNQLRGYEEFGLGGFLFGAGVGVLGYKLYLDSKTKKGKEKIKKTYTKIKKKVGLD